MIANVHDFGSWLTIGIDATARAGCYYPEAFAYVKWPGRTYRLRVTLPHLSFRAALRLRLVGGLKLYSLLERFYFKVGR
jgi:hypothetical protein